MLNRPGESGDLDVPRVVNDLREVLTLAGQGLIMHHVVPVKLDDVNDTLEALGGGEIVGRVVVVFD